jgi:hypothetical protein
MEERVGERRHVWFEIEMASRGTSEINKPLSTFLSPFVPHRARKKNIADIIPGVARSSQPRAE